MKVWATILALCLLLTGCSQPVIADVGTTPSVPGEPTPVDLTDAVVTGGTVFLVGESYYLSGQEGLYSLPDGEFSCGEVVDVYHDGMILETWPAQFANILNIESAAPDYNRIGLFQQTIRDLLDKDEALNDDISQLVFDFTGAPLLTSHDRAALLYWAWCTYSVDVREGTFAELEAEGLISGEFPHFKDGLLITVETEGEGGDRFSFRISKWRSALGAYGFDDCTAVADQWNYSYTIGSEWIS